MRQWINAGCIGLILTLSGNLAAQDIGDLISGSKKDANYLMEGYAAPFMKTLGSALNQGWYNTAKPHKKFGVDLTISVAAIAVPSSDKFFTVDNSKLSALELTTDHNGNAVTNRGKVPTLFGPGNTQSEYAYQAFPTQTKAGVGGEIDLGDLPMSRIPVPVVNLGFGLPMNTDIKFRFIPSVGPDEAKFSLFGVGVMHDVKQHIPGIKMLPFDLSGFVGYTRMSVEAELDDDDPDKKGESNVNSTTVQGLISKKIAVLTVYGGVGYNFVKANLAAKGNYDLDGQAVNGEEAKDPVDLSVSASGPRLTTGLRLKLAVITLHGDYTFQKYSALTVGFGINVR